MEVGRPLATGEEIRADSPLTLVSPRGALVTLAPRARVRIEHTTTVRRRAPRASEGITLLDGNLRIQVPPHGAAGSGFFVSTRVATIGVRGTDFAVGLEDTEAEVAVFEDAVWVEADDREIEVEEEREARVVRGRTSRPRPLRPATREKFARFQERLADALIERFGLTLDGDPSLQEVLRKIPEVVRERIRNQVRTNLDARRRVLREALERSGAVDTSLPPAERFRRARDAFERLGDEDRDRMRRETSRFFRDLSSRFRLAADSSAARGDALGESMAETFRRWADEQEAASERIARMRPPEIEVSVDPPRGIAHRPIPHLAEDHPLRRGDFKIVVVLRVGPLGAVRRIDSVEIPPGAGVSRREVEAVVRGWRFAEIGPREGVKTYRVEIRTRR